MRYTRKFIEARFAMAMDAIGAPHGDVYTRYPDGSHKANVGVHFIDYAACYGGYTIAAIANEAGGENRPYGMERHSAAEFVALLDGIPGAARYLGTKGN